MYANPVRFQPFSNREDFLQTVSIYDDDTGQPVNLSGTIGAGTFSNWNVRAGVSLTTSLTTLTIPSLPIGAQLSTLALTVGTGLVINAGDPITITDISGNNSMQGYVLSYNKTTGVLTCQIGLTFVFEIRRGRPRDSVIDDYSWYFDFGTLRTSAPLIAAALGTGLTIIDVGFLQIRIPVSSFNQLNLYTYLASLTMTDSYDTRQLFLAELPVLYGGTSGGAGADDWE
jgi:hypothetical protein